MLGSSNINPSFQFSFFNLTDSLTKQSSCLNQTVDAWLINTIPWSFFSFVVLDALAAIATMRVSSMCVLHQAAIAEICL